MPLHRGDLNDAQWQKLCLAAMTKHVLGDLLLTIEQ